MTRLRLPLLAIAALALAAGCRHGAARAKPPIAVRVEPVAATTQASSGRYSGTVLAHTQVELAFRVGGYIHMIGGARGAGAVPAPKPDRVEKGKARGGAAPGMRPLQAGDPVSKDMLLAALRKEDFKQRSSELNGMSAEASAGYRSAKQDYDRSKGLLEAGVISQAEFDNTKARYEQFAGSASAANARASQANLALADSQLRSPLDGIVLDRRVEIGSLVAAGTPAFVLADTSTVKVIFGVPDSVQRGLAQGQPVTVATDAVPDRVFSAVVTKIAAQADSKTRAFDIEASLDNADGALKVGMITTIQLGRAQEGPTILVPLSSIVRLPNDTQGFAVYLLVDNDAHARVRAVELGNLVGNRVSVVKGLAPGDRLVVQGATLLRDGDNVNVVPGAMVGSTIVGLAPSSQPSAPR